MLGGDSTRCTVCRPVLALSDQSTETFHHQIHKKYEFSTAPCFSPLCYHPGHAHPCFKRRMVTHPSCFPLQLSTTEQLSSSEGGPLSHPRKGEKTLVVGTFCILLKHLILQKYVISNQPVLIVHLEYNQLFYCKITLSEK